MALEGNYREYKDSENKMAKKHKNVINNKMKQLLQSGSVFYGNNSWLRFNVYTFT